MDLNLNQLKYLRGVLSLKRCYKPYEDRGDCYTPKGALWCDDWHFRRSINYEHWITRMNPIMLIDSF